MKNAFLAIGFALVMVLPGRAQLTMNFDSLDTSGGPVTGTELDTYLATYGITLTGVTADTTVEVVPGTPSFPAYSQPNLITQTGSATGMSYTLTFAAPVSDISFVRGAEDPQTESGVVYPQWTATAYNGATELGSVGESLAGSFTDVPAASFTLNYSGITSLTIEGNAEDFAGLGAPMLDNFTFTEAPEPSTWAMFAGGLGMLALWRLRKQRAA